MKKLIIHNNTQYEVRFVHKNWSDYILIYELSISPVLKLQTHKLIFEYDLDDLLVPNDHPDFYIEAIKESFLIIESRNKYKKAKQLQKETFSNWNGIL